ncbi:molybdopterin-dependent oxidoreductase [Microvirga sp. CF3062]|uniref:molybdopterin-dependent oxidoreductase n=1 Tax=Microvirga sp. CF3062 TaxID=3110182 RepID=UPI002E7971AB|nr:molybdopterin-dependent oxidoreductase [Microvirga sp. CF3062]MEE1655926.1 molybdopterin-dependent oxidoreductase [Microvirga sp. CF3062]
MSVSKVRTSLLGVLIAIIAAMGVAYAASLAAPADRPILTISGKISATNKDGTAQFDRPMLEALGMVKIETTTPWHEGKNTFEGISLDKLMQHVGATGQRVVVVALNDYTTDIPVEDFRKFNVILALKRNGDYMSVRDKGPLFIIYPYDSNPDLKSQTYYARSAWQVARIDVR